MRVSNRWKKWLLTLPLLASPLMAQLFPFPGPGSGGAGPVVWTKVQDKWGNVALSGTTITTTLSSAPTAGNLVVCVVGLFPRQSPTSVQDNAATPNTYTLTPSSPAMVNTTAAAISLAYLVAPVGAGAVITATAGTTITGSSELGCAEYHKSLGTPALDTDAAGNGGGAGVTVINTPSVTVAAAGELLTAGVYSNGGGCQTLSSPWVKFSSPTGSSNYCGAYVLSASAGSNAINFTQSSGGLWNSMLGAFR